MLRNRLFLILAGYLLATSAAWADDVGFVDCHDHSENIQVLGKAAKTSEVVASLPCGERFTVLVNAPFFSRIQTKDGKVGYIHSYLISRDYSVTSVQPSAAKAPAQTQPATAQAAPSQAVQSQPAPADSRAEANASLLTNKNVVDMLKVGLTPEIVLAKIKSSTCNFDTSPGALEDLKAAKVPDAVILAMVQAPAGLPTRAANPTSPAPSRKTDELTVQFKRLQNSVVTVWSEIGDGTGFIVDAKGLVLTNQHVVGPSEIIAVQFDQERKVRAILLAADPSKDVAVLWANLTALPDALVAPIARTDNKEPPVVEGERVFTIGSPLSQRKILTTGIASKIEARAIISDININPGNSGGPLFNSLGYVVGLTTFHEQERSGPGISGIVRIEEAFPLLDQARARMASTPTPDPTLLPVEPTDTFPVDAIKEAAQVDKFDTHPYVFGAGDYDVAVVTPVLKYHFQLKGQVEAAKEKEKRTKKKPEAVKDTFRPLDNLRNWAEYAGQYKPVLLIQASPKLRETFWSAFGRGLAASGGYYGGAAKMRFKTDFYRMRLLCAGKEIQPIQPAKVATIINVKNPFVNATDATYEGLYSYPANAIAPSCNEMVLELYSEKDPSKATRKALDKKTVDRVWSDFEPYRRITAEGPRADQKP